MFKSVIICCFLSFWGTVAFAHPEKMFTQDVSVEPRPSANDADSNKRRAALRAALLAQQEKSRASENVPRKSPELSPMERAQLRQQLRQQGH